MKSSSRAKRKKSKNRVSPFRTEDIFVTYGQPEGYKYEPEIPKEIVTTYHKKKGPSYSQLQKKKKKSKVANSSKKQTFYEKVLSKTIGHPMDNGHLYTRNTGDEKYLGEGGSQTNHINLGYNQIPTNGRNISGFE